MLSKIYKITLSLLLVFFYQNIAYPKNFDEKNLHNYFSALISLEKNKSIESLNYFNSSKELKESHPTYIKKYLFALVLGGKIDKAISEIKTTKDKKLVDFFEAHLLLVLDSIKKKDYKKSLDYINNLKRHEEEGTFQLIVSNLLTISKIFESLISKEVTNLIITLLSPLFDHSLGKIFFEFIFFRYSHDTSAKISLPCVG